MLALKDMINILNQDDDAKIIEIRAYIGADQPQFYERFVSALLQQLSEKIDKVREVAGRVL